MSEIAKRAVLIGCAMLLAFGASELIARLAYRAPWYDRLIADQKRAGRLQYQLNSLGLRDREYAAIKPAGTTRVLLLGDSFTFGVGVAEDSAVMPKDLERLLNRDQHRRFEVLNGGLVGSLTGDWLELFRRVGPAFHPDVVIVDFFLRDGTLTGAMSGFFEPIRDGIVTVNRSSRLYLHCYLYRILKDQLDRRRVGGLYGEAIRSAYFGTPAQTVEWQRAQQNLLTIAQLSDSIGARFGLAVYPILVDLTDPRRNPFRSVCDTIAGFARAHRIPAHDLLQDFSGQDAPSLWVSPTNQHPNAKAHAIAADGMLPFVRGLLN